MRNIIKLSAILFLINILDFTNGIEENAIVTDSIERIVIITLVYLTI